MDILKKRIDYLAGFATPERVALLAEKLALRTRHIAVCVEDLFQPQNTSAVLRSCEAFGVQDVHIVERTNHSRIYPDVTLGTDKWLTIHRYAGESLPPVDDERRWRRKHLTPVEVAPLDSPLSAPQRGGDASALALERLRAMGYRIVATAPGRGGATPEGLDLARGPVALMFGTERSGLSDIVMEGADEFVHLPMAGFVESLNVSVAVAVTLYTLSTRLRQSDIGWQLGEGERDELMLQWLSHSVRSADEILMRFDERR